MLGKVILALAKRGLPHRAIATALSLTLLVLRRYFAEELLQGALYAELTALVTNRPPAVAKKTKEKEQYCTEDYELVFYNNDHEPNADY